jgi:ATP-binding cassette, subfamily B, bacterial
MKKSPETKQKPNLFAILKPYGWLTTGLVLLGVATNGLNLILPKIIAYGIDLYVKTGSILSSVTWGFAWAAFGTFVFAYLQSIAQTYASEKVARDLREQVIAKVAQQSYTYIQELGAGMLLTNLTSDIDNIKTFVGQAVVSIISSAFLVLGAAVLMLMIDWRLALAVLAVLPFITVAFGLVFSKLKPIFKKSQEVIDWLNKIINGSVLGAAVVRVLNSKDTENAKFAEANTNAVNLGIRVVRLFAITFPIINFIASIATLVILMLGGHFIINGTMTIGNFTAFVSYLGIIIFPLIMIGFLSNSISRASASYARIFDTLNAPDRKETGTITRTLKGDIELKDVSVTFGEKSVLKDVSFSVPAGTRTAILGPTAAGKTHLLYLLIGILTPNSGIVKYDGTPLPEYHTDSLHAQVGIVFQDSIMFNMSLRENIAFSKLVTNADLKKALETAELSDFVDTLPGGLDAMVMERGTSLSGGQKQRIMLARALALNPRVLLLDDFTARVDGATEQKILANVRTNYPDLTLVSVTQKIASIEDFDQVVLLMEGEVLAKGTHAELMQSSPEYVQIYDSQRSTTHYEETPAEAGAAKSASKKNA